MSDPVVLVSPHDLEAEKSVLGAVLMRNGALTDVTALVSAVDFFRYAHQRIFDKMVALSARGVPIDLVTLKDELQRAGELEDVGGPAYIAALADGALRSTNAEHYAGIVKDLALTRTAIAYANQAVATFTSNPAALKNGEGTRFAEAFRRVVEDAHTGNLADVPLRDDVAILDSPYLQPLIEGVLFQKTLAALIGPPGIGKTSVALEVLLSSAAGRPRCLGHRVQRAGASIHVLAEGSSGARIGDWKIAHGYDLDVPLGLYTWDGAVNLLDAHDVGRFIAACKPKMPIEIVAWDTFSRCFVGGDENSARDVGIAVSNLDRVRRELEATQFVLHHMNAGGSRERGSTALRAACDTFMYLQKADDLLQLTCDKQKDAEPFAPIDLALVPAYPGAKALVVRLASEVMTAGADELSDAQGKALHVLVELFGDLGATSKEWEDAIPAMHRATFYRARRVLIDAGYVRNDTATKRFFATGKRPVARCRTAVAADSEMAVAPVAQGVA